MSKTGKNHKKSLEALSQADITSWESAIDFITKNTHVKFDETVDVDITLGIDPTKGEQTVRGSALLPHGRGKKVRVLAFAKGEQAEIARLSGADYVGAEDFIEKIKAGWVDFEASVATPDMMGLVGAVAKILGPRGLLPNKKIGTVADDLKEIVSDLKKGRVFFRNDKGGCLHAPFGKVSFGSKKLLDNLRDLIKIIQASKPAASKGKFIKKITLSSSMGAGVTISPDENF